MKMGKRILIVDDSAMMRKMIRKMLMEQGHDIVGDARNGEEALALYKELKPEVVTMDITMRGMDGLTAAREIINFDDHAKIIFLSNLEQTTYSSDVEKIGAVGYVSKSDAREMLAIIERL
jgi:two-component system, chemotaxis family, chemotaxis protein CheY